MKFAGKIAGVFFASVFIFIVMAMTEEWQVFEPWLAGKPRGPGVPSDAKMQEAIRALAGAIERGDVYGPEGSPTQKILQSDQQFRQRFGVRQRLSLQDLTIEKSTFLGPGRFEVTAKEKSQLSIARKGRSARTYVVEGTWQYTIAEGPEGLVVVNFEPAEAWLSDPPAIPDGVNSEDASREGTK